MRVHIPVTRIQNAIDEMVRLFESNDARAPVLVAQAPLVVNGVPRYAAGHANAGNPLSAADLAALQKHGNSLARHIWAKIESLGIRVVSGLETLSKSAAWTAMSLDTIGYQEGSLRALEQLIGAHNREAGTRCFLPVREAQLQLFRVSYCSLPPDVNPPLMASTMRFPTCLRRMRATESGAG